MSWQLIHSSDHWQREGKLTSFYVSVSTSTNVGIKFNYTYQNFSENMHGGGTSWSNTPYEPDKYVYKAEHDWDGESAYNVTVNMYLYRRLKTPPAVPSSIIVPSAIRGGENINISWSSSTGAAKYYLERSVNGGAWVEVYNGISVSYTDSITKGWLTVAYRVRAYNTDGYSAYRTSPIRIIINFPEFNMKVNGLLKTSDSGWVKINGSLKEIDSIHIKINGVLKEV